MNNISVSKLFNAHKVKYEILNNSIDYDKSKKRTVYFIIDLEYILTKYLYNIGYIDTKDMKISEKEQNKFITEILNLICHYKNYFFKYMDALSFFYIAINNKRYKNDKQISDMIKYIISIVTMIPRINVYYYEKGEQNFYLKFNLVRTILITRKSSTSEQLFFNLGRCDMCELFYRLTKNFYIFNFEADSNNKLYGFNSFYSEHLYDVEPIYLNAVISLLSVYEVLDDLQISKQVRIDDVILKYIKSHVNEDFNAIETKILVLKLFTNMKRVQNKLVKLESNLNSPIYQTMIQTIMANWKHVIKDRSVYQINEMLKVPHEKRINIELLMNC